MLTPYYQDSAVTIYHGDCREILPSLEPVDLVLTDPPYGISLRSDYKTSRLGGYNRRTDRHNWTNNEHLPLCGDSERPDVSLFNSFPKVICWGANNYAAEMPNSYAWLVWDKRTPRLESNNFSDCELAYTRGLSLNSVRILRHMWAGYQRDSEIGERVLHPTQKPVALMKWCLGFASEVRSVVDPYCGSGPVLRAAKDLGLRAIGIEIEERYAEIAARRMEQEVLNFGNEEQNTRSAGGILAQVESDQSSLCATSVCGLFGDVSTARPSKKML